MDRQAHTKIDIDRRSALTLLFWGLGAPILLALVLAVAHATPAAAESSAQGIQLAFDLQTTLQPASRSELAGSPYEPVSQDVLAAQRGSGASFALPVIPAVQSHPGIVLWDELKPAQNQNISTDSGQAANQINIQFR